MRLPAHDWITYTLSLLFVGSLLYTFASLATDTHALTMSNADYMIQMGNLNSFAGNKSNGQYSLSDTGGQTGAGLFSGQTIGVNYKVRSGFQYIHSIIPFRFSISGSGVTRVDFGSLDPTSPVVRYQALTVNNGSANGYVVTAFEDHPLLAFSTGQQIPDTTCDSGTCTQTTAAAWTSNLTYGFGYRCNQLGVTNYCVSDFNDATFYKQFADISANETPQIIMQNSVVGNNQQVQIVYKVNVSAAQPSGSYVNDIQYIATPTY